VGRIGKQCRERWTHHLRPDLKKEPWSYSEEMLLASAHKQLGNRWSDISKSIPGRSENSVKNHWNAVLRRKDWAAQQSPLRRYMQDILLLPIHEVCDRVSCRKRRIEAPDPLLGNEMTSSFGPSSSCSSQGQTSAEAADKSTSTSGRSSRGDDSCPSVHSTQLPHPAYLKCEIKKFKAPRMALEPCLSSTAMDAIDTVQSRHFGQCAYHLDRLAEGARCNIDSEVAGPLPSLPSLLFPKLQRTHEALCMNPSFALGIQRQVLGTYFAGPESGLVYLVGSYGVAGTYQDEFVPPQNLKDSSCVAPQHLLQHNAPTMTEELSAAQTMLELACYAGFE